MLSNKKLGLVSLSAALASAAVISSTAFAATTNGGSHYSALVNKIASTFHLDPSKVQQVIQQQRQSSKAKPLRRLKVRLDKLVADGTISQTQENSILSELKTLRQTYRTDLKSSRQTDLANLKSQLQQWLDTNGYNVKLDQIL